MLEVVLFFLGFAFLLYALLGGADFGAGIIELFSFGENRVKTKLTIYRVIGPIWEANHMWLIIVIVILWVGFPGFYHNITTYLHLPITFVLFGITLRGVAFVVRHYDAYKDRSQIFYDRVFRASSLVTPIGLGMAFGAIISGEMTITEHYSDFGFKTLFLDSWLNTFSILCGLFYAALCAFFSSILLIGEVDEKEERNRYVKKSIIANSVSIFMGFLLILYGFFYEVEFIKHLVTHPYFIVLIIVSSCLSYVLYVSILKRHVILTRTLITVQFVSIVMFPIIINYPDLILAKHTQISLLEGMAAQHTIDILAIILLIASVLVLPPLFYLFKSFDLIKILKIKSGKR